MKKDKDQVFFRNVLYDYYDTENRFMECEKYRIETITYQMVQRFYEFIYDDYSFVEVAYDKERKNTTFNKRFRNDRNINYIRFRIECNIDKTDDFDIHITLVYSNNYFGSETHDFELINYNISRSVHDMDNYLKLIKEIYQIGIPNPYKISKRAKKYFDISVKCLR